MIPNEIIHYKKPVELEPYRVIAVDASDIVQKGAVKKTWHLHYGTGLFSLTCNQFKLTEQSTGESLKNFDIKEKDLIIADRAYGTIRSMEHCLNSLFVFYFPAFLTVFLLLWFLLSFSLPHIFLME